MKHEDGEDAVATQRAGRWVQSEQPGMALAAGLLNKRAYLERTA